ncbi:diguanylate cyclase [Neptuniibacter sp.]|uniref:sensor domain-containing diguanylate cyclase n=1 Tax=Neptuniibacter sp. TaxID=1962643 RepID=UPI002628AF71|nr:diguanylate cyclase [Neptuniibacter sp.]MCP4597093.1 diguanylate cyclase [Neptuniibacter sp.]
MSAESLFRQIEEAFLVINPEQSQPVFLNEAACKLLSLDKEQFVNSSLWLQQIQPLIKGSTPPKEHFISFQGRNYRLGFSQIHDDQCNSIAVHLSEDSPSEETLHNFYDLVDNLGAYVFCKDTNFNYTYANQQVCELFSCSLEEIIGHNDYKFFGENTGKELIETYDKPVIEQGQTQRNEELLFVDSINEYRHYLSVKKPLFDQDGKVRGLFGISTDITQEKKTQTQLRESELRLRTILDNVGAYIYIKDKDRRFKYINKMTEELFQRKSEEIVGLNNFDLLGPEQGEEFDQTDRKVFELGKKVTCLETFTTPDDILYYWSVKIPLQSEQGEIDHYIGISTDITDQKRLEQTVRESHQELELRLEEIKKLKDELQTQATHDSLTGLYNRRYLEDHSPLSFTDPSRGTTSLLMVDIDNFKSINDTYGHGIGDKALKLLADTLSAECRSNDLICRYGGDEFIVILPNTPQDSALMKAEWIRKNFQLNTPDTLAKIKQISISIGIATSPDNADCFEKLYNAADKALYAAKKKGRNCCVTASESQ